MMIPNYCSTHKINLNNFIRLEKIYMKYHKKVRNSVVVSVTVI